MANCSCAVSWLLPLLLLLLLLLPLLRFLVSCALLLVRFCAQHCEAGLCCC
jgi:hypothetical protein